jgi:RimJ/RimL family protein N-acetyltransferase
MAAFTPPEPADPAAFQARLNRMLIDHLITIRTVLTDGEVAGSILSFEVDGRREVSYWLGRAFWGRGIATAALAGFLGEERVRPLYARAAADNAASLRVLEKNGFRVLTRGRDLAPARGEAIDEFLLILDAKAE